MKRLGFTTVIGLVLFGLAGSLVTVPAAQAVALAPTPVVQGKNLVDSRTNTVFVPRGVNWPSFEYACWQGWGYSGSNSLAEAQAIASWKINTVRLPLNQDCWLGRGGSPANGTKAGYRAAVLSWVQTLNSVGLVVILDLHSSAPSTSVAHGQRAMADAQSIEFWQSVATDYSANKSVIFDLFNEPYSRSSAGFTMTWDIWKNGGGQAPIEDDYTSTLSGTKYTTVGMAQLVSTVRTAGATQPIMLGGMDYSNDLRGWLANRPSDTQLVASWHNYPGQRCSNVTCWNAEIAPVAAVVPIVTGEFGQTDGGSSFLTTFMNWADTVGVGYLPWAWWDVPASESVENARYALYSGDSFTPKAPSGTTLYNHLAALGGGSGPPVSTAPLVSAIQTATGSPDGIAFSGWVVRPDAGTVPVGLAVNIGSRWIPFTANQPNTAAPLAVYGAGPNQGFSGTFSAPPGSQSFCIWAQPSTGAALNIGCRTVVVPTPGKATTNFASATVSGNSVTVTGWALYPDADSISVPAAVNIGSSWYGFTANAPSTAASTAVPGAGPNHGYSATYTLPVGTYSVCVWVTERGGAATNTGCRVVTIVPPPKAVNEYSAVSVAGSAVTVSGWSLYPSALASSSALAVQVGSSWYAMSANLPSAAAEAAVPGAGPNHGFSQAVTVPPGSYSVCIWVAELAGTTTLIGCKPATVAPAPAPIQSFVQPMTTAVGTISVAGWSVWTNSLASSVPLAVQIDSVWTGFTANQPSAAAETAVPGAGPNHGFAATVATSVGAHTVCVWATLPAAGGAVQLACQTVVVPAGLPVTGKILTATGVTGGVQLTGWAVRPEALSGGINIAANIGNQWAALTGGQPNAVAPTVVPGAGPNQGYSGFIAAPPGARTVCVWATGATGTIPIDCANVVVP